MELKIQLRPKWAIPVFVTTEPVNKIKENWDNNLGAEKQGPPKKLKEIQGLPKIDDLHAALTITWKDYKGLSR